MTESEMGDLQDAISFSGLVPQSCIPTFDELESWTDGDADAVRAWVDIGGRGPTPTVFHDAIARYHAPRPSARDIVQTRHDRRDAHEDHAIATTGRDVGLSWFDTWSTL